MSSKLVNYVRRFGKTILRKTAKLTRSLFRRARRHGEVKMVRVAADHSIVIVEPPVVVRGLESDGVIIENALVEETPAINVLKDEFQWVIDDQTSDDWVLDSQTSDDDLLLLYLSKLFEEVDDYPLCLDVLFSQDTTHMSPHAEMPFEAKYPPITYNLVFGGDRIGLKDDALVDRLVDLFYDAPDDDYIVTDDMEVDFDYLVTFEQKYNGRVVFRSLDSLRTLSLESICECI